MAPLTPTPPQLNKSTAPERQPLALKRSVSWSKPLNFNFQILQTKQRPLCQQRADDHRRALSAYTFLWLLLQRASVGTLRNSGLNVTFGKDFMSLRLNMMKVWKNYGRFVAEFDLLSLGAPVGNLKQENLFNHTILNSVDFRELVGQWFMFFFKV